MSKLKVNEIEPFSGTTIGIGGPSTSTPSAIIDIQSISQGVLPPRMTTAQRDAIVSPAEALLIYNLDDNRLEQYSAGQWTVVGNGLSPIKNMLRVIKNTVLNAGDFSSLATAIASVTDATPTNQYIIFMGPGVFTEPQIQMKPYVYVLGADMDACVIAAADPNNHLILGTEHTALLSCSLDGVTLAGKALVYYGTSTATAQTAFWVEDVRFRHADTLVIADGLLSSVNLNLNKCKFGGQYQFNTGFVSKTTSGTGATLIIRNSSSENMSTTLPADLFVCDGANCRLDLHSIVAVSAGTAGNCVRLRNGGKLLINGIHVSGWAKGLFVENVGTAPSFSISGAKYESNTNDLTVNHPTTVGAITGAHIDRHKISINPSNVTVTMHVVDASDNSILGVGTTRWGPDFNNAADVSTLLIQSTTMGLLVGGGPTYGSLTYLPNSLVVTAQAGIGYVKMPNPSLDPLDFYNVVRKIPWPDEDITLPANSECWVYYDNTSTLQFTTSGMPDNIYNVIMGRVVTNATGVEFAEESGLVSEHTGNYIGEALRKGLGPIYNAGSTIVELGTRTLQIAAGDYYFGERHFQAQGGVPITFNSYYQDGSGGFNRVPNQTIVDNAFWDDGSGTLSPLGAGNYTKHSIYLMGDASGGFENERYFLVYGQTQYASLVLVEQGSLSNPPSTFSGAMVLIASIVVQQGMSSIIEVRDERPLFSSKRVSQVSATTFHHNLLGLNDFDDHLRYLPVNGSRPMTGDLPMGGNDINNVDTVNAQVVNVADIPLGDSSTKAPNTKFVDQTAIIMALIFG